MWPQLFCSYHFACVLYKWRLSGANPAIHGSLTCFHEFSTGEKHVFKALAPRLQPAPLMRSSLVLAALLAAAPLHAQSGVQPPQGWSLGLFIGGSAFTDFQRSNVRSVGMTPSGRPYDLEYVRRIGAATSGTVAGTLAFWPSRNWGGRARGAYAPSHFETEIPQADAEAMEGPAGAPEATPLAALTISSLEGQLLFRMPTIHNRIMPYGIVGGGVIRYMPGGGGVIPDEAELDFEAGARTRPDATVGLGAMLGLQKKGWGLHFELVDQISRSPVTGGDLEGGRLMNSVSFTFGASWTHRL